MNEVRPIKWHYMNRDNWLKDVPNVVSKLSSEYNFYWSTNACKIQKDVLEVLKKHYKRSHKIMMYYTEDFKMYLVVLCRGKIDIYYSEYAHSYNQVDYIKHKCAKRYVHKKDGELC